ncbi:MAG: hypothetical protein RIQ44_845, partial [Actinomycetota bacterium]
MTYFDDEKFKKKLKKKIKKQTKNAGKFQIQTKGSSGFYFLGFVGSA